MKIVVIDGYTLNPGDLSWDGIKQLGEFVLYDRTPAEKTVERTKGAQVVLTNKVLFSKEIIDQLPDLKYIGVLATGYNIVDLEAASRAEIVVTNIPAYGTASVAQMVFSLILHIVQNVSEHVASIRAGNWASCQDFTYHITPLTELAGKTLGIIGFGQIGRAVAQIGRAFGMNMLFYDALRIKTTPDFQQVDLDRLFIESDFISINCPLTESNAGFINKAALEKMKSSAILINTGRGPLVNEYDLAEALNNERIAGAGLDVLAVEPPAPDNPLITAKNCCITPHIAWATTEARERLMRIATNNLIAFINGKPVNVVI